MLSWNQVLPWGTHMNQDPTTNCLKYCFYCMDTVTCMNCMADENVFIPRELHLDKPPQHRQVCKRAHQLLKRHDTVLIDKRNPLLKFKPDLRRILVQRRKVHKMFDLIKCDKWELFIKKSIDKEYMFLLLRDCYLTFELIGRPSFLQEKIMNLQNLIKKHLDTCKVSRHSHTFLK